VRPYTSVSPPHINTTHRFPAPVACPILRRQMTDPHPRLQQARASFRHRGDPQTQHPFDMVETHHLPMQTVRRSSSLPTQDITKSAPCCLRWCCGRSAAVLCHPRIRLVSIAHRYFMACQMPRHWVAHDPKPKMLLYITSSACIIICVARGRNPLMCQPVGGTTSRNLYNFVSGWLVRLASADLVWRGCVWLTISRLSVLARI
jgi:hypothetical protein